MKSHIHLTPEKKGVRYAEVYTPQRKAGKKINSPIYLGKVINLEKGIFFNRKRGYFRYTIEKGFETCDFDFVPNEIALSLAEKSSILDFGSAYLLWHVLHMMGFFDILCSLCPSQSDSLLALLFYRIQEHGGYNMASEWLAGSYAQMLFPKAQLTSQRISELLKELGAEIVFRRFFSAYLKATIPTDRKVGILVDSTGLPNSIDMYLTALNNHNGVKSNETRLLLVVDKQSGKPLFFRYNPGNIKDVTTLHATILELEAMNVDVSMAVLDAGYFSEDNVEELCGAGIAFLSRLPSNRKLYKKLISEYHTEVLDACNIVKYGSRLVGIKRVTVPLCANIEGYAYVAVDYERRHNEWRKYTQDALDDGTSVDEIRDHTIGQGFFVLICSENVTEKEILPLYYTRQAIEQIFDVNKNDIDILPLRVHSEETLRGHLMLSFIASLVYIFLNDKLKATKFNACNALAVYRNLKCMVYDNMTVVKEPVKNINDLSEVLGLSIPKKIVEGKTVGN